MVYQFKLTLLGIEPPIWRRILVEPTMTMEELHYVTQSAFRWEADWDYEFSSGRRKILDPDVDSAEEDDEFASDILVGQTFRKAGDKWLYAYDLEEGNWQLDVVLEEIVELNAATQYPICTGGARACPPQDIGGVANYLNDLLILKNPKDPSFAEIRDYYGEYDPEAFDKDEVNAELHNPDNWVEDDEDDIPNSQNVPRGGR